VSIVIMRLWSDLLTSDLAVNNTSLLNVTTLDTLNLYSWLQVLIVCFNRTESNVRSVCMLHVTYARVEVCRQIASIQRPSIANLMLNACHRSPLVAVFIRQASATVEHRV